MEIDGRSRRCTENWRKLIRFCSCTKINRLYFGCTISWRNIPQMHGKLTEVYESSHGCTEIWRKVPRLHGKVTEVDRRSLGCKEIWRKVPRLQKRLMEADGVLVSHQKVDGRSHYRNEICRMSHGRMESSLMLTKGAAATRNVVRRSGGSMKSWQKLKEVPANAQKVDGRSRRCTEIRLKLMEGLEAAWNIDGRSRSWMESWRKFKEGPADTRKVDERSCWCTECWRMVPQMHG